jgi:hypothetical protein
MRELARFFKELTQTAEQLGVIERIKLIALKAFRKLLSYSPPLPPKNSLVATG